MNEQLVVKNFGPIKDATVDFKRVTVFIGPTGGGKSTLAKLAAIFRDGQYASDVRDDPNENGNCLENYNIKTHTSANSLASFSHEGNQKILEFETQTVVVRLKPQSLAQQLETLLEMKRLGERFDKLYASLPADKSNLNESLFNQFVDLNDSIKEKQNSIRRITQTEAYPVRVTYIPAERAFLSALQTSWAGLMRDDIGLPKTLLNFANDFLIAREHISEMHFQFIGVQYVHIEGKDVIVIPQRSEPLKLSHSASGIQSVTPLLVLLEHLSRNMEQAQSFIIEEPELNLYPTAQQGLLNWLVEKCTKGENDLTITTHSPYLLAHFNLLLYAYQVAENHPKRADDVAKIVPRESWINPKEFAAYHVEGQKENGVHSIINPETGLISYNGLDATANAETSEFEKLMDINAGLEVE